MTFSLFKEVIMMKKLALVAAGILCTGLLGACSSQGMATSNKDMSQQTAKADIHNGIFRASWKEGSRV